MNWIEPPKTSLLVFIFARIHHDLWYAKKPSKPNDKNVKCNGVNMIQLTPFQLCESVNEVQILNKEADFLAQITFQFAS
jgi:hypothetical protein